MLRGLRFGQHQILHVLRPLERRNRGVGPDALQIRLAVRRRGNAVGAGLAVPAGPLPRSAERRKAPHAQTRAPLRSA